MKAIEEKLLHTKAFKIKNLEMNPKNGGIPLTDSKENKKAADNNGLLLFNPFRSSIFFILMFIEFAARIALNIVIVGRV